MTALGAHWTRPIWDARFDDPASWLAIRASRAKCRLARVHALRFVISRAPPCARVQVSA